MRRTLFLSAIAAAALAGCDREPPAETPASAAPGPAVARAASPAGETLRRVRARGVVNCGVNPGLPGFAFADARGVWRGLDADFCRAVSAAVFGRTDRVQFVPVSAAERFEALTAGRVDLLARNTTVTLSRDAEIDFAGPIYYDGQGFLVRRALALTSASELSGARVCVLSATTTEKNLADFFQQEGVAYEAMPFKTDAEARAAYGREDCDAYAADVSTLASARAVLADPAGHVILPDVISKEPLSPAVRQGDARWADVVAWTLHALVAAEELGVTAENAEAQRAESTDPEVRRLLGIEGGFGTLLGLRDDWAYAAIRGVGNYGEMFERNVGQDSPLRLERGLNALWNAPRPGLMYSPPFR